MLTSPPSLPPSLPFFRCWIEKANNNAHTKAVLYLNAPEEGILTLSPSLPPSLPPSLGAGSKR